MAHRSVTRLQPLMAEAIGRHFPALTTPIVEPSQRDQADHDKLALIVASSTLREQLHDYTGDQLDIRVAYKIAAVVISTYLEARAS